MIHVKKNIRDSFQFVFFFGGGGGKKAKDFLKKAKWHGGWIGVNYVANNIILQ